MSTTKKEPEAEAVKNENDKNMKNEKQKGAEGDQEGDMGSCTVLPS